MKRSAEQDSSTKSESKQSKKQATLLIPPEQPMKIDLDFLKLHPFIRQTCLDKVYGCIIGSALGDTIGLYTEFLSKSICETFYKKRKFSLVEPTTEWVSDTHRSFLYDSSITSNLGKVAHDFASRLRIWIEQGLLALDRHPCGIGALVGSVVCHPEYLEEPFDIATKAWIKTTRHVAPNRSLMRTHPIGVICVGFPEEEAWEVSIAVGRTTHVDPRCVVSCCISVGIIRGLLSGEIFLEEHVNAAIERAYEWVLSQPDLMNPGLDPELTEQEIRHHLDRKEFDRHVYATTLVQLDLDNNKAMGYVYKCLGSAILTLRLAMRAVVESQIPSPKIFEDLMTDLIMEGGDADTNGAAAGALLGTFLGNANLPPHWANGLVHKEWLISKISRLTAVVGIGNMGEVSIAEDETPDAGKGLTDWEEIQKRNKSITRRIVRRNKARAKKGESSAKLPN